MGKSKNDYKIAVLIPTRGRTTALQTGSPEQFLNVLSGAAGSASQVYSSENILLQDKFIYNLIDIFRLVNYIQNDTKNRHINIIDNDTMKTIFYPSCILYNYYLLKYFMRI